MDSIVSGRVDIWKVHSLQTKLSLFWTKISLIWTKEAKTGQGQNMLNETEMRHENEQNRKEKDEEERTKNSNFVQVYSRGWKRLQQLIKKNPNAARLYALLAEHIDGSGVVVATQAVLAEMLEVSEKTIQRRAIELEKEKALIRIRISGGVYAYALHPEEVWKAWDNRKAYATFYSKTLVSKKAAGGDIISRKLQMMIKEQKDNPDSSLD